MSKRETDRLTVYIPVELHLAFKVWCAQTGTNMSREVTTLLRDHLTKNGSYVTAKPCDNGTVGPSDNSDNASS